MSITFDRVSYENPDELIFGNSKNSIKFDNGMEIGGGMVYPEINFTLSSININKNSIKKITKQYQEITEGVCERAVELYVPGLVVEIELLPPTTYNPEWGIEIIKTVKDVINKYQEEHNIKGLLRATPVDIREDKRSEHMWRGKYWDKVMKTFRGSAEAGADLLSIESIGGKNLHDEALMYCQLDKSLFSLGVLGARDMSHLWSSIVDIADETNTVAAGDTACAFANTAMVMGDQGLIPKVFSAVVRVMSAIRSMVALEKGAIGPHKDCGYEGIYIKAITGTPISMEGRTSAVAHLSPVGNIAACAADLWSNESVQNVKLLGGKAPTISMEQLAYDCRLMNTSLKNGKESSLNLRNLHSDSDSKLDPNAYVLKPEVVVRIAKEIVKGETHLQKIKTAAVKAIEEIRKGIKTDKLKIDEKEIQWLDMMEQQLASIPDNETKFTEQMLNSHESDKFAPEKYDL
ncbi:MAG: methyltransferase MtaB domain-containing protein [Bacillota bacterium]